jgi:hypothetical protein
VYGDDRYDSFSETPRDELDGDDCKANVKRVEGETSINPWNAVLTLMSTGE